MMGPVQAIKTCLAKSFQFSGRASRAEFWWFGLIYVLLLIGLILNLLYPTMLLERSIGILVTVILYLTLALLPVYLAMTRRLRDAGLPGALALLLPAYVVISTQLARWIDASDRLGIPNKNVGMPELAYALVGFLALSAALLLLCLLPTQPASANTLRHEEIP